MKFKKISSFLISLISICIVTSSCNKTNTFSKYNFIEEVEDLHIDEEYDVGYSKIGDYKPYFLNQLADKNINQNVFTQFGQKNLLKATGDQKLLVIPVEFFDYTCEGNLGIKKDTYIETLNKVFFGSEGNTKYYSVSEYYNISSYGKLRLDGEVCDVFYKFKESSTSLINASPTTLIYYYKLIIDWYISLGKDIDKFKIDDSKDAKDNNVAIYLVYTHPYEIKETESFFWAYSFTSSPLSWSSFSFIGNKIDKPDTHTFIHEVGHLLGLEDYYPRTANGKEPTHCLDMMDASLGDQTAFSKMFLDWTRPYSIDKTCEIKLKPFTTSGELIIISDDWNKTVFDDYYLIEYYSPVSLNKEDSILGNSIARLPNLGGIKIYHVDARLAYFNNARPEPIFGSFCKFNSSLEENKLVNFANSNNKGSEKPLYELILNEDLGTNKYASNEQLFHIFDEFDDFKLNKDDRKLDYKISIKDLNNKFATIVVEKN